MKKTVFASNASAAVIAFANAPAATGNAKPRVEPTFAGVGIKLDMPERASKRGSVSVYPFDKLEVGTAFGVKNKTAAQMSSIVSNANKKGKKPVTDAAGNPTYEMKEVDNGQGGTMSVPDTTKPVINVERHFFAIDVNADYAKKIKGTELEGSTVLVFRDK